MLNVFNPHLSTPVEKTVVYDFALPNPGEICKELRLRKVQHYLSSLKEEKTLAVFIPLTLLPKNHNLFANIKKDETEGGKKRKIRVHSLIMQKYNSGSCFGSDSADLRLERVAYGIGKHIHNQRRSGNNIFISVSYYTNVFVT
jgi:hypothetical protein